MCIRDSFMTGSPLRDCCGSLTVSCRPTTMAMRKLSHAIEWRSRGLAEVKDQPAGARRPAVGREIHRWRRERAMTLARVAERSGLNIGYLSQIENEKAMPSLDALGEIAAALDVPVAWLLVDSSLAPRVVRAADRPRRHDRRPPWLPPGRRSWRRGTGQ